MRGYVYCGSYVNNLGYVFVLTVSLSVLYMHKQRHVTNVTIVNKL